MWIAVRSGSVLDIRRPFQGWGRGSWASIMALLVMLRHWRFSCRRWRRRCFQQVERRRGGIRDDIIEVSCDQLLHLQDAGDQSCLDLKSTSHAEKGFAGATSNYSTKLNL